jgi:hypothetical protein
MNGFFSFGIPHRATSHDVSFHGKSPPLRNGHCVALIKHVSWAMFNLEVILHRKPHLDEHPIFPLLNGRVMKSIPFSERTSIKNQSCDVSIPG